MTIEDRTYHSDERTEWLITPTCRICRAAWHLAPGIITTKPNGQATFARQPEGDDEVLQTWRAAVACPTGSILAPRGLKMPEGVFPQLLDERLYRLGYNDNSTAGAHPYFIRSSTGLNIMIDGPRYVSKLVDFFEQQGGLDHVLLTHRDDVGASAKYAERFGARLWIHENERFASPEATDLIRGYAISEPIPGVTFIPIPGHTIGSVAFLADEKLFVGDSLSWELDREALWTNPLRCWDDWSLQVRSLRRFQDFRFTYMLAGHGGSIALPHEKMQAELAKCLDTLERETWEPLTHFPDGTPIPEELHRMRENAVPQVKADFYAELG